MNVNGTEIVSLDVSSEIMVRAEHLIWRLLDDQISDDGTQELEELLNRHQSVRQRYLSCVALHSDLTGHFRATASDKPPAIATTFGLADAAVPTDTQTAR